MILVLGTNFVGRAFATELRRRGLPYIPLSREALDFGRFDLLLDYLRKTQPEFVINAESYTPDLPANGNTVDRLQAIQSSTVIPRAIARACRMTKTPWAHLASGSIYSGARILGNNGFRTEPDLTLPRILTLFSHHPQRFRGFEEHQAPNFTFHECSCAFASGVSALAEEELRDSPQLYIWRIRLPFNESPEPWNFLSQLREERRVRDAINSVSHLDDAVRACLELRELNAPYGTYNIANPGAVTKRQIVAMIRKSAARSQWSVTGLRRPLIKRAPSSKMSANRVSGAKELQIATPCSYCKSDPNDTEFFYAPSDAPESNCILDTTKLQSFGVKMRSAEAAVQDALNRWPVAEPNNITRVAFK